MASPSRSSANEQSDNNIGLDVGGKIYRTSRTTLTRYPGSFFDGLLASNSKKDVQGNYLIDRNGDIFRHVLNFLRCGELVVPARYDVNHWQLLEQEAEFFMLDTLKWKVVESKLNLKYVFDEMDGIPTFWSTTGFNVGGNIYRISAYVLERNKDSFLSRLYKGVFPSTKDDQGNYVIDRDGEIFQHVLEFMASGELVLPEGFDEFALLEQEAYFFLLDPLKEAIRSLEMVGFVVNNQVFKLKQKNVLHYKESLLAKYPKDTQGYYLIERDLEAVDHVMSYFTCGGIVKDITLDQLGFLRKDAEKLQLHNLPDHCKSLEFMKEERWDRSFLHIHVYNWLNGPCIAYTNKSPRFFRTLHPRWQPEHAYYSFFHDMNEIEIGDGKVSVAKVVLKDGRLTRDDIISYFGSKVVIDRKLLDYDCTRITVYTF